MSPRIPLLTILALVLAHTADAAVFCVGNGSQLQAALNATQSNGENDDVRLRPGTYSRVAAPSAFVYASLQDFDLSLSGGWNAGCTAFNHAQTTILDGGDARRVMELSNLGSGTSTSLIVYRLVFSNGLAAAEGGGLRISGTAGNTLDITVFNTSFLANVAGTFGGGLYATSNGTMRIGNNLFLANEAQDSGAAILNSNDAVANVVNNTIIANQAPMTGGLRVTGSSLLELANNILWANGTTDLMVQTASHNRYHNNIGALVAPAAGVLVGEIDTAPEFQSGLLNFDPRPGGRLFNGGYDSLPGGLPTVDLAGRPRIDAGRYDIGAYEAEVLFYSGFEP
jgi:predicted outer membrane repeat protein